MQKFNFITTKLPASGLRISKMLWNNSAFSPRSSLKKFIWGLLDLKSVEIRLCCKDNR